DGRWIFIPNPLPSPSGTNKESPTKPNTSAGAEKGNEGDSAGGQKGGDGDQTTKPAEPPAPDPPGTADRSVDLGELPPGAGEGGQLGSRSDSEAMGGGDGTWSTDESSDNNQVVAAARLGRVAGKTVRGFGGAITGAVGSAAGLEQLGVVRQQYA